MCTLEKRGNIFILTLTGPGEHRLNPTLLDAIQSALSLVRAEPTSPSSVLITTAQGKFFSNGIDLTWGHNSQSRHHLLSSKIRSLIIDFLSLPMPTIAAVSGHVSAGGFILALSHDYVLMRKDRGFIYMSELDIGITFPAFSLALIRCKIGEPMARCDLVLTAAKLTAEEAIEMGIIDSAHDSAEETVAAAVKQAEELVGRKWDGYVYAQIRMGVLSEVLDKLRFDDSMNEVSSIKSKQ